MKKIFGVVMCAAMLVFGSVAHAERWDWRDGILSRVHQAERRVDREVEARRMEPHIGNRLQEQLEDVRYRTQRLRGDRRGDRRERELIDRDLDNLERQIDIEERRL